MGLVQQGLRDPRVRRVEEGSPDEFEVRDKSCVLWRGCDVGARVGVDEKQESRLSRQFEMTQDRPSGILPGIVRWDSREDR